MDSEAHPKRKIGKITPIVVALIAFVILLVLVPVFPETESASVTLDSAEPSVQAERMNLLGETATRDSNAADIQATEDSISAPPGRNPDAMKITVPKLGLKNIPVPSGSTQERLDREGLLRLSDSGVPWRDGSNTFIAGHTLGYDDTRVPYAFYDLAEMKPGDEILIRDSSGERYVFRVFDQLTVQPSDYWVTYPDSEGRTLVSLQACVPYPTFEDRLIVRAELVP